ncbi:hypothetical protein KAU08_07165, partial [bacterium]|nr:hypothetical protein [bacterium]
GPFKYMYDMTEATPNLTVTIFQYALSPYETWKGQAWAGSLLITGAILVLSVIARVVFSDEQRERG